MHVDSGRVSLRTESCQHWPWEKLRCLSLFQSRLTGNQKRMVGDMSQDDFFQQAFGSLAVWPRTVPTVLTPQSLLLSGTLCFKHFVSRGLLASTVWVPRRGLAQIFSLFFSASQNLLPKASQAVVSHAPGSMSRAWTLCTKPLRNYCKCDPC